MIWVFAAIVIIIGVSALITLIGSLLPAKHSVSRMAQYNRSPEDIWDVMTDFANQTGWRNDVLRVERLPDRNGRQLWQETDKRGQAMTLETVEATRPRRLVRRIADENQQFGGQWTYEVGDYGEVTSLTVTEDGEIYNPVFRFFSRVITGQTATIDQYLRALGSRLGVDVTITGV